MELRNSLFWDTDTSQLNWETHAKYVIERVIHRGTWNEFKQILGYYGRKKIKNIIKNLRYMDVRVMYFCSLYFDIPLTELRCYNTRQLKQTHWNY